MQRIRIVLEGMLMQDISAIFADDGDSFEDLDKLFSQLEQFEPPADMVGRIMDAVNKLPPPWAFQPTSTSHDDEGLLVRYDHKQPS